MFHALAQHRAIASVDLRAVRECWAVSETSGPLNISEHLTSETMLDRIRAIAMLGPPSMFETPHPAAASLPQDGYIQPTFVDGLRIWWAFWWPTMLLTVVLVTGANIALRYAWENSPLPGSLVGPIMKYDAYFISYFVAYFIMWRILTKNFRHYHIGLLSNQGGEGAEILRVTPRRVVRVWWTYSWRSILYRLIIAVAASFPLSWIMQFLIAGFKLNPLFTALLSLIEATLIDAAAGLYVIYSNILDEDISDFRVALLPRRTSPEPMPAPISPASVIDG